MSTDGGQGPFDPDDRQARNERLHRFAHDLRNKMEGLHQAYKLSRSEEGAALGPELDLLAERSFFGGAAAIEALLNDLDVPRDPTAVTPVRIDLPVFLQRAVEGQGFRFDKKRQHAEMNVPALSVRADEHLLGQLLEAVLSNAIKFSPEGSTIGITAVAEDGRAVVRIIDPGVGLAPSDVERIFERYAILGSRATQGEVQNRGTLTRARRWAAAQGIDLAYSSEGPGKGSTCTLHLPLYQD
ncbi:MAG TPA: sensor histidine kinase [Flavobacteriales bacterium]